MINIILNGCGGKMGKAITTSIINFPKLNIVAGIDAYSKVLESYPIFKNILKCNIEADVVINDLAWLMAINKKSYLSIAKGTRIGHFSHIICLNKITIKENVLIADKVYMSDSTHGYEDIETPIKNQPLKFVSEVEIGENAWIGENVSIIGCKIGRNSVIGANSVVTKDIPEFCVAVGAPAKVVKRFDKNKNMWLKTSTEGDFFNE